MRKKLVTRTITTTKVVALCLDTESCEPCNETVTLAGTFKDDEKILKATKGKIETDTLKVVKVVSKETEETLYGMDEETFIKNAEVLPPRTTAEATAEATAE